MGDEKREEVSMGCKVEESFCSICGGVVPECEHTRKPTEEEARAFYEKWGTHFHEKLVDDEAFKEDGFIDISFVGPSKCGTCKAPMEPVDSIHWACVNEDCDKKGIPVHTGVYPIIPIKDA